VIFEEALPAPADAPDDGTGRRVTELVVELSAHPHPTER
jgi:hypothetical protein